MCMAKRFCACRHIVLALTLLVFPLSLPSSEAQVIYPTPHKKIIEFGWDIPSPAYLRDHLPEMEKRPFQGVAIRLPEDAGGGNVFDLRKWDRSTAAAREREMGILASLPRSDRLTDNFLTLYGASTMEWFNDADWKRVIENVRFCAKAAKIGGCKGICWDAEPYGGHNPWRLQEQPEHGKHTFAEYYRQVRKRGAEFMRALQDEFPGQTILALRLLSDFQDGSPFSQHLFPIRDDKKRQETLQEAWWALHPAFVNGLLDAAEPNLLLVDGNEDAYFYTSPLDFYRIAQDLRQDALMLVAPENRRKYAAQYRLGQALSIDYTLGLWAQDLSFPDYLKKQALELTPEQRLQWFEHNAYYAMTTADEYVWCYSEDMNWWTGKNLPAGIEGALRSACRKFEAGEPLGFTVETLLQDARRKLREKAGDKR